MKVARAPAARARARTAVEGLAALAGDPVAAAEAAVAADDTLALGHIYRAYLALCDTTAEGAAAEILKKLTQRTPPTGSEYASAHAAATAAFVNKSNRKSILYCRPPEVSSTPTSRRTSSSRPGD